MGNTSQLRELLHMISNKQRSRIGNKRSGRNVYRPLNIHPEFIAARSEIATILNNPGKQSVRELSETRSSSSSSSRKFVSLARRTVANNSYGRI